MKNKLIANGFVIINNGLDLNNLNSYWLVNSGIINEDDLSNNNTFSSNIIQLNFITYEIILNRNSIILRVSKFAKDNINEGIEKLEKLLENLKNVIFLSCGINYNWIINGLKNDEFLALSKKKFFVNDNPLYERFNYSDACFGAYMSKDFKESRLKLDIKPVLSQDISDFTNGALHFNFNFHKDLKETYYGKELQSYVEDWESYLKESEEIINLI